MTDAQGRCHDANIPQGDDLQPLETAVQLGAQIQHEGRQFDSNPEKGILGCSEASASKSEVALSVLPPNSPKDD